jgi:hypothetical protein
VQDAVGALPGARCANDSSVLFHLFVAKGASATSARHRRHCAIHIADRPRARWRVYLVAEFAACDTRSGAGVHSQVDLQTAARPIDTNRDDWAWHWCCSIPRLHPRPKALAYVPATFVVAIEIEPLHLGG